MIVGDSGDFVDFDDSLCFGPDFLDFLDFVGQTAGSELSMHR